MRLLPLGIWLLAVVLTSLLGIWRFSAYLHYLLFWPVWLALTIVSARAYGPVLVRLGWRAYVVAGTLALAAVLYYTVGRPIELDLLSRQSTYPATREAAEEILLPLVFGTFLAVAYLAAYGWLAHLYLDASTDGWQEVRKRVGAGLSLYLLTGVMLWLHSASAWFFVRVVSGMPHQACCRDRFVDDVGPHTVLLQVLAWPLAVTACCG